MDLKTVLVHVEPAPEAQARLDCAVDLAERNGALLIGCGCEAEDLTSQDPFAVATGEVAALKMKQVEHNVAAAREAFEARVGGLPHRWAEERLSPVDALALHARAADIVVTSRTVKGRRSPARDDDPGLITIIAGRPVLVAPSMRAEARFTRVLVCWKDTREARRALADLLPLLKETKHILVVEVAGPTELAEAGARAADVAGWLQMHGAPAESESLLRDERQTSGVLLNRASCFDADLIVAGGYGRTRLGEWAFGGVTRSLLAQQDRFVLLSH